MYVQLWKTNTKKGGCTNSDNIWIFILIDLKYLHFQTHYVNYQHTDSLTFYNMRTSMQGTHIEL